MKTYQDLMALQNANDEVKAKFCKNAIEEFKTTPAYRDAMVGDAYYNKHNLTIENYQKTLRTLTGRTVVDTSSANYKLKTLIFRRLVTQISGYILSNGVTLSNPKNKEKLGRNFDKQLSTAVKSAMSSGISFGFWNVDHLEVFGYTETEEHTGFCPLYDEESGEIRAGIRFWTRYVDDSVILRATLYEEDGFTSYKIVNNTPLVLEEKRGYIRNVKSYEDGTIEDVTDYNYNGKLPIIPMYVNDTHQSELIGIRESIDCMDFIKSGFADNIDDASEVYWILQNTGGMDDVDLAQFMQRMKTVKAAVVDSMNMTGGGASAEAHTLEVPTEARTRMLEILRKDIYEDFQALDVNTLSASAKTTQEIQAAYQSQDNKCGDVEFYIIDFVQRVLGLAGIDDEPTFRWNKVINQMEQTQMVLQSANYLTDEVIIKHLPFLTPEEADEVIKERKTESYEMYNAPEEDEENENEEEPQNTEE